MKFNDLHSYFLGGGGYCPLVIEAVKRGVWIVRVPGQIPNAVGY